MNCEAKSCSLVCCARQCYCRSISLYSWSIARNRVFSNAGYIFRVRGSTIPTFCFFSAKNVPSFLYEMFRNSRTRRSGTRGWPARWIYPYGLSLQTKQEGLGVPYFCAWSLYFKGRKTTAIRSTNREILYSVSKKLEIRLQEVIRESCGPIEHQWKFDKRL